MEDWRPQYDNARGMDGDGSGDAYSCAVTEPVALEEGCTAICTENSLLNPVQIHPRTWIVTLSTFTCKYVDKSSSRPEDGLVVVPGFVQVMCTGVAAAPSRRWNHAAT